MSTVFYPILLLIDFLIASRSIRDWLSMLSCLACCFELSRLLCLGSFLLLFDEIWDICEF